MVDPKLTAEEREIIRENLYIDIYVERRRYRNFSYIEGRPPNTGDKKDYDASEFASEGIKPAPYQIFSRQKPSVNLKRYHKNLRNHENDIINQLVDILGIDLLLSECLRIPERPIILSSCLTLNEVIPEIMEECDFYGTADESYTFHSGVQVGPKDITVDADVTLHEFTHQRDRYFYEHQVKLLALNHPQIQHVSVDDDGNIWPIISYPSMFLNQLNHIVLASGLEGEELKNACNIGMDITNHYLGYIRSLREHPADELLSYITLQISNLFDILPEHDRVLEKELLEQLEYENSITLAQEFDCVASDHSHIAPLYTEAIVELFQNTAKTLYNSGITAENFENISVFHLPLEYIDIIKCYLSDPRIADFPCSLTLDEHNPKKLADFCSFLDDILCIYPIDDVYKEGSEYELSTLDSKAFSTGIFYGIQLWEVYPRTVAAYSQLPDDQKSLFETIAPKLIDYIDLNHNIQTSLSQMERVAYQRFLDGQKPESGEERADRFSSDANPDAIRRIANKLGTDSDREILQKINETADKIEADRADKGRV